MQTVKFITINENNINQRIDNFLLTLLKKVPKSHIYKIIRTGQVRVNKKRVQPIYKLQLDDVVRVPPVKIISNITSANPSQYLINLLLKSILFEDKNLLIINKPAGIAVHGGSGISFGVIEILRCLEQYKHYLELVHRLDRDTSGCLVLAKKSSWLKHLQNELRNRRVEKKYLAVLVGDFVKPIVCQQPLLKITSKSGEKFVQTSPDGKPATTIFTPIKKLSHKLQLTQIKILTGRTHQIRVHAQSIKHPILGDTKYGVAKFKNLNCKRMFLHAEFLGFKLPDGNKFTISATNDFAKFMEI